MSFLSVFKSIGNVLNKINTAVTPLEPVIGAIPVYGAAFDSIFNAVVGVEQLFAGAGSTVSGSVKKSVATTVISATSPSIPTETVGPTIDQMVAYLNQLQELQTKIANLSNVSVSK